MPDRATPIGEVAEVPTLARMMSGFVLGAMGATSVSVWIHQPDGSDYCVARSERDDAAGDTRTVAHWPLAVNDHVFGHLRIETDSDAPEWRERCIAEARDHVAAMARGLYKGIRWQLVELAMAGIRRTGAPASASLRVDANGMVLSSTDQLHEVTGWCADELVGLPIQRMLPRVERLDLLASSSSAPVQGCTCRDSGGGDCIRTIHCVRAGGGEREEFFILVYAPHAENEAWNKGFTCGPTGPALQ